MHALNPHGCCFQERRKHICPHCVLLSKLRASRCFEIEVVLHVPMCSWTQMNKWHLWPIAVVKYVFLAVLKLNLVCRSLVVWFCIWWNWSIDDYWLKITTNLWLFFSNYMCTIVCIYTQTLSVYVHIHTYTYNYHRQWREGKSRQACSDRRHSSVSIMFLILCSVLDNKKWFDIWNIWKIL